MRRGKQSLLSYHLTIHKLLDLYQFSTHFAFSELQNTILSIFLSYTYCSLSLADFASLFSFLTLAHPWEMGDSEVAELQYFRCAKVKRCDISCVFTISWNDWGWKASLKVQSPCSSKVKYSQFLRTVYGWVLNISTEGDSANSPGNLCQCSAILTVKGAFLCSVWISFSLISAYCFLSCQWASLRRV